MTSLDPAAVAQPGSVGVRRHVGRATDLMLAVVVGEAAAVAQRGKGFGPVAVTSRWGTQSST